MWLGVSGKHPVSALTELCTKRRWGAPAFELINETGPAHKKMFLFKVTCSAFLLCVGVGVSECGHISGENRDLEAAFEPNSIDRWLEVCG